MKSRAGAYALVAIVSLAAFAISLASGLIYDDNVLLFERLKPQSVNGFAEFWQENYWGDYHDSGLYRPLGLTLSYAEKSLFGSHPAPYHAVSLLLYIGACLAAFWLLSDLFPMSIALAAALLFAAHPIHAEAAATLYGQLDSAASLFVFLTLIAWRRGLLLISLPLCFAALCFKETAIITPLLAILIAPRWKLAASFSIPIGAYLGLRWKALGSLLLPEHSTFMHDYSLVLRIKVWIVTLGEAIRSSVAPWAQTVYYGHLRDELLGRPYADALWILTGIGALWMLYAALERKYFILGAAWFVIAFLPMSNLLPTGVIFAERSMFLPVLGAAILAASLIERANTRGRYVLASLLIVGLVLANRTAWTWRNEESLWRTTIADHPTSPYAHAALGWALIQTNPQEAGEHFRDALQLNPTMPEALRGLQRLNGAQ